jgi:hypothetical protein
VEGKGVKIWRRLRVEIPTCAWYYKAMKKSKKKVQGSHIRKPIAPPKRIIRSKKRELLDKAQKEDL